MALKWNIFERINVLIVDDDMFNRQLIISFLSKIPNISCIEAENGIEALALLKEEEAIDIILLDLHMPKMNGAETLLHIKKETKYDLIPIVLITTDENELKQMNVLDADDVMFKPFKGLDLETKIFNCMIVREEKILIQEELIKEGVYFEKVQDFSFTSMHHHEETLKKEDIILPNDKKEEKEEKEVKNIEQNNEEEKIPIITKEPISIFQTIKNFFKNFFSQGKN